MKYKSTDRCSGKKNRTRHIWRDSRAGDRIQVCSRCNKERKLGRAKT